MNLFALILAIAGLGAGIWLVLWGYKKFVANA